MTLLMRSAPTIITGVAALILILAGGPVHARFGPPTEAVKETINEVIRLLTDKALKKPSQSATRRRLIEKTIGRLFDYEEMAKRTLAMHWRNLNEQQKPEFVHLFKSFLAKVYAKKIEGYAGEQVHYLSEQLDGAYAQVQTQLVSDKLTLPLDYHLLKKPGGWYVYDVVIDGVSLVRNYRDQFDRIIHSSSYADLVKKLREKSEDISSP